MEKQSAFALEWQKTIRELSGRNAAVKELAYFLTLGEEYADFYRKRRRGARVILLDQSFPDELVRAMDIDFYYACGGSYESTRFPQVNLPKDTDDLTASVYGILTCDALGLTKDDMLLVPLCSDNMKKLKALADDFVTVVCYEVPADKESPLQRKRFAEEIESVTAALKKHFHKSLPAGKLKEQCVLSEKAAQAFCRFEAVYREKPSALSASAFVFVANSYNMCKNKAEWISHLEHLTDELEKSSPENAKACPEIMLFGSPIYAPNYKLLFAVEQTHLRLRTVIHPDIAHVLSAKGADCKSVCIRDLALRYLDADISPSFLRNRTAETYLTDAVKSGKIKGMLAHILKGQFAYDYAFAAAEKLLADYKIPLNRIETVYNYQDIEQIKIRLEAFSEMLAD